MKTESYLSLHIFYNTIDLRPVLLSCVDPLIQRLEEQDLLDRYFFVRYWEEGAHVRLRLLPKSENAAVQIRQHAESSIARFLEERPSFFDADPSSLGPLMKMLFEHEHGTEAWTKLYGENGSMPIAENNSFSYRAYQPEYDRYGGPLGIELSEQHFHASSQIALEALRDSNCHVQTSLLGLAIQMMVHFGLAALEDKAEVIDFFKAYVRRWSGLWDPKQVVRGFQQRYDSQAPRLREHFQNLDQVHQRLRNTDSSVLGKWLQHAYWLRDNVARLYDNGELLLEPRPASAKEAMRRLMVSYIHMMNNRLGVLILEEVYLARMIVQSLGGEI